jgi:hypothetical protein
MKQVLRKKLVEINQMSDLHVPINNQNLYQYMFRYILWIMWQHVLVPVLIHVPGRATWILPGIEPATSRLQAQ